MIFPLDYTHLGYRFLDKVSITTLHSGCDLNVGSPWADKGMPLKAMSDGLVVYSKIGDGGWGNLIVLFHHKYKVWSRLGHCEKVYFKEGAQVGEGDEIGTVGNTGNSTAPHAHFDIIHQKLPSWTSYTKYWSSKKIREYYYDPISYIKGIQKMEEEAPTDNAPSVVHKQSWDWGMANKITSGENPKGAATREQAIQMIYNYHKQFKL